MPEALPLIWMERLLPVQELLLLGCLQMKFQNLFLTSLLLCYDPKHSLILFFFFFSQLYKKYFSFLAHKCAFSLLLMGTVMKSHFVHVGTTSTFLSGRQQWSSGGLFWKSVAILIYIQIIYNYIIYNYI